MTEFHRNIRIGILSLVAVLGAGYFLPDLLAEIPATVDLEDPVDRRSIDVDPSRIAQDRYHAAKKAEAAAMVRWFEARLRLIKFEAGKQAIEHKFNQDNYDRLLQVGGSIAEIKLLEARKQTQLDDLISAQLKAMTEMAEADVSAARARLESLD